MTPEQREKAARERLIAEGNAKMFDNDKDAASEGFNIICGGGLYLKSGTQVPRDFYAKLADALK